MMNSNLRRMLIATTSVVALSGCGANDIASPGTGGNVTITNTTNNPPAPAPTPTPTPTSTLVTAASGCPTISEPAGLTDRGTLRAGAFADVTVFDPATVIDKSTYETPFAYNAGIEYVIVNGSVVLDRGTHTGALPGRALRAPK